MHACLYGLAHVVIVALGCARDWDSCTSGMSASRAMTLPNLYKAEVTIPIAFREWRRRPPGDLPAVVRRRPGCYGGASHILERMVHDIRWLLLTEEEQTEEPDVVYLWIIKVSAKSNGINYFDRKRVRSHRSSDHDQLLACAVFLRIRRVILAVLLP